VETHRHLSGPEIWEATERNDINASITVEVGERRGRYGLRVRMFKKFQWGLEADRCGNTTLRPGEVTLTITHQEKDTGRGGWIAGSNSGDHDIEVTIAVYVRHRPGVMGCERIRTDPPRSVHHAAIGLAQQKFVCLTVRWKLVFQTAVHHENIRPPVFVEVGYQVVNAPRDRRRALNDIARSVNESPIRLLQPDLHGKLGIVKTEIWCYQYVYTIVSVEVGKRP